MRTKNIIFKVDINCPLDVKEDILEREVYPVLDKFLPPVVIKEINGNEEVIAYKNSLEDNILFATNKYNGFMKFADDLNELNADQDFDVVIAYNLWHEFYQEELKLNDSRTIDFLNENIDRIENRLMPLQDDTFIFWIQNDKENVSEYYDAKFKKVLPNVIIYKIDFTSDDIPNIGKDITKNIVDVIFPAE